jgi:hypothetical protein
VGVEARLDEKAEYINSFFGCAAPHIESAFNAGTRRLKGFQSVEQRVAFIED